MSFLFFYKDSGQFPRGLACLQEDVSPHQSQGENKSRQTRCPGFQKILHEAPTTDILLHKIQNLLNYNQSSVFSFFFRCLFFAFRLLLLEIN